MNFDNGIINKVNPQQPDSLINIGVPPTINNLINSVVNTLTDKKTDSITEKPKTIKLLDYNPDYEPKSTPKPFIYPDSIANLQNTYLFSDYHLVIDSSLVNVPIITNKKDTAKAETTTKAETTVKPEPEIVNYDSELSTTIIPDILFIVTMSLLFIFAFIRLFFSKALNFLSLSLFNYNWSEKVFEEKNAINERVYSILEFIFYINFGITVYYLINYFVGDSQKILYHPLIVSFILVSLILFIRYISIYFISALFLNIKDGQKYLTITNVYHKYAGLLLFISILTFAYLPEKYLGFVVAFTFIVLLFALIMPIIRGLMFISKRNFSFLYYFLYLCTVEIFPIMILLKYLGFFNIS